MKLLLRIIDYLIIGLKIFGLIIFIINYESALNKIAKETCLHYMIPFIFYAFIGIWRIWKFKNLQLLFFEIICNIYFILTVSSSHAFYLILTFISLAIVLYLFYNRKIMRKI